jgi:hypothetical protein
MMAVAEATMNKMPMILAVVLDAATVILLLPVALCGRLFVSPGSGWRLEEEVLGLRRCRGSQRPSRDVAGSPTMGS